MFTLIIIFAVLTVMLWIGFKMTGALLMAFIWLFVRLPISFALFALGLIFCCTILLIPLGIVMIKAGAGLLLPGAAL